MQFEATYHQLQLLSKENRVHVSYFFLLLFIEWLPADGRWIPVKGVPDLTIKIALEESKKTEPKVVSSYSNGVFSYPKLEVTSESTFSYPKLEPLDSKSDSYTNGYYPSTTPTKTTSPVPSSLQEISSQVIDSFVEAVSQYHFRWIFSSNDSPLWWLQWMTVWQGWRRLSRRSKRTRNNRSCNELPLAIWFSVL